MKKIICAHLYNDFSGSPLVLSTAIKNFIREKIEVEIITSKNSVGFLSDIKDAKYNGFKYHFYENKLIRIWAFFWSQIVVFLKIINDKEKDSIIYVNTLLPFGAALAGRMTGKKVVYHLHETTVNPPILKSFLKKVALLCADQAIYVSNFLLEKEGLTGVPSKVVYNCLSDDFTEKSTSFLSSGMKKKRPFNVLMLCSLKEYKGVDEFVELARSLPQYRFLLVLNSDQKSIKEYFVFSKLPVNLIVFPAQKDVHSFYTEAHLVLNLSHPDKWVETFGMTLLEAMSYGLPVIGPPVGGPAEFVVDGRNGFQTHQQDTNKLKAQIHLLANDGACYDEMSSNAIATAKMFLNAAFCAGLLEAIGSEKKFENATIAITGGELVK